MRPAFKRLADSPACLMSYFGTFTLKNHNWRAQKLNPDTKCCALSPLLRLPKRLGPLFEIVAAGPAPSVPLVPQRQPQN